MQIDRFSKVVAIAGIGIAFAACSGGMRSLPSSGVTAGGNAVVPQMLRAGDADAAFVHPHTSKITLSPASLALLGSGTVSAKPVKVSEAKYTGTFTQTSTCKNIATAAPASGKGPTFTVTVTGVAAGSCSITFSDSAKNKALLPVSVTTMFAGLTSASISTGAKSIAITLTSVNGKAPPAGIITKVTPALPSCASSCKVAGPPAPAGTDVFSLVTYDAALGKGNKLATGSVSVKVVAGKATTGNATLAKIPAFALWGTLPAATAGTAFAAPATLPLTIQDADHNAIAGTYSVPVTIADADASPIAQGSSFSLNGGTASRSVQTTKSTDALKFNYGGLAMVVASLAASATGITTADTSFSPVLPAIVNSVPAGPLASHEIDLYNIASGQPGFSGAVTALSQAGWNDGIFSNDFTYTLGGTSNNCTSFAVTGASGTSNAYTVDVTTSATPAAGQCTMTLTGGGNLTTTVLLTYTTSGFGINARHTVKP